MRTRAEAVRRLESIREEINALLDEAIEILRGSPMHERPPAEGEPRVRTTRIGTVLHWAPTLGRWVSIPKD